jgi:hypothetical protein
LNLCAPLALSGQGHIQIGPRGRDNSGNQEIAVAGRNAAAKAQLTTFGASHLSSDAEICGDSPVGAATSQQRPLAEPKAHGGLRHRNCDSPGSGESAPVQRKRHRSLGLYAKMADQVWQPCHPDRHAVGMALASTAEETSPDFRAGHIHRTALVARKAVAKDHDDINISGALGDTLVQNRLALGLHYPQDPRHDLIG